MKLFTITPSTSIICQRQNTRNGFRHVATLMYNGAELESAKASYLNRTWESYQFESVLSVLAGKVRKNGSIPTSEIDSLDKAITETFPCYLL